VKVSGRDISFFCSLFDDHWRMPRCHVTPEAVIYVEVTRLFLVRAKDLNHSIEEATPPVSLRCLDDQTR
jgi:hypothetical protein